MAAMFEPEVNGRGEGEVCKRVKNPFEGRENNKGQARVLQGQNTGKKRGISEYCRGGSVQLCPRERERERARCNFGIHGFIQQTTTYHTAV